MFTRRACASLLISLLLIINLNIGYASGIVRSEQSKSQTRLLKDLTRYVDPFIGTSGHGHTFPGATLPFGMVQLSPDTRLTGWDGCSGYHYSDNIIYGFSHTHLSGTGISDYGDILFMPTIGPPSVNATGQNPKGYATSFKHENETASPGYYSVKLDNGLKVDLTTTARAGFHRYTFPSQSDSNNVILDLVHRDKVLDASLRVIDETHIEGFRRSNAWARNQVVYFAAVFSRPFTSSTTTQAEEAPNIKASFSFENIGNEPLLLKVGISAVSAEGARKNLDAEISHWDFEKVRNDAKTAWNRELNKIQVSGGDETQLKNFYTALYHINLQPNISTDVDGQYLGRDFLVHNAVGFDNYTVFSLWDTFRATHPLYTIIDQKRTSDFIKTFLAQYRQGGRLPVWELAANETDTMIGYHAVSVIADAVIKGIGGFDREFAFEAMKHSAELKHYGLGPYIEHGYLEMEAEKESVSKTLEYAYDDWCIAVVAKVLNHENDYLRYMRRAQSYKNIFDRETGFVRPRTNGGWLSPFEPREVNFNFTEANAWQYTFFAPQDIAGLIDLIGGEEKFAKKLDDLFAADSKTTGREQADITGLIGQYAHGNEPSHHVAYLYNYVRQPWKTQFRIRQIMDSFYKPAPDGLIGNEDCGQMSAWYVLSAVGFYPVTPGSPIYAIGTPLFPEVRFNLENGKTFVIRTKNVSTENFYIQSAVLNGRAYGKSFIRHEDLMAGGEAIFEMGNKPNLGWATRADEVPVSKITTESVIPVPIVKAASKTFKDRIEISFQDFKNVRVYYTTDGTEPDAKSTPFTPTFLIESTTTVKARAIDSIGRTSQIAIAHFRKMPHSWNLTLKTKYSTQYSGGGDLALIDGIRGTKNVSGGAWQGYQGKDLVAIVDLGELRTVSKLGAGFLQDVGSWIWMPVKVDFEVSTDGQQFEHVLTVVNDVSSTSYESVVKDLTSTIAPRKTRYVRMTARSFGKLPGWHPGAGGDSWIFADEILIE